MNHYLHTELLDDSVSFLHTEQRNPDTEHIADVSTLEMVTMINREDQKVAQRVYDVLPVIAEAIDYIYPRMKQGGRLVYCAAGTSGRLGVMDAAECPPTYGVDYDRVTTLMAGGRDCVFKANELLEDNAPDAEKDLIAFGLTPLDTVVAAAASGRTPYGIGALKYADKIGAGKVCIVCNPGSEMGKFADVAIEVDTGAECVMGSTRMKAGTAQKFVMNMLSTSLMIKLGRTDGNLLIHSAHNRKHNSKIANRQVRVYAEAIGTEDLAYALESLRKADGCSMCGVMMEKTGISKEQAREICDRSRNCFAYAMEEAEKLAGKD